MASTNKTTHYELPQWIGTDKPTFLGDLNQAFEDIDTGIYNAATAASNAASAAGSAQSAAATAQSAAESAGSTASAANTLATTANTNAVSALNAIGSTPLQTTAQTLTAAVNEVLHDIPDDATDIPYDNQTSGLSASNVQAAIDEIAQGGGTSGNKTLKGSSTANTSYASQLTEIETLFNTLTAEEKRECYIQDGDGNLYKCETTSGNVLFNANYIFNSNINFLTLNLTAHTLTSATISTGSPSYTEQTTATFTGSYRLYA